VHTRGTSSEGIVCAPADSRQVPAPPSARLGLSVSGHTVRELFILHQYALPLPLTLVNRDDLIAPEQSLADQAEPRCLPSGPVPVEQVEASGSSRVPWRASSEPIEPAGTCDPSRLAADR
jgi:hypothetical protein